MTKNKITYCSQCKNSKYIKDINDKTRLQCSKHEEADVSSLLDVSCTYATYCPMFVPERKKDVTKPKRFWTMMLKKCNIDPENPNNGENDDLPDFLRFHPPKRSLFANYGLCLQIIW